MGSKIQSFEEMLEDKIVKKKVCKSYKDYVEENKKKVINPAHLAPATAKPYSMMRRGSGFIVKGLSKV